MNFLMLRGEVPQDRNPQEIAFDKIEEIDDVWTQLFFAMLSDNDHGELWYWGGTRKKKFTHNFTERWVPTFVTYRNKFVPDVIFCRGGFIMYHHVLRRFPNAIKIYYGAGRRFLPQPGFDDYDIILQDSIEQVKICDEKFPNKLTTLFIKPAADNIFFPMPEIEKDYDVCFPANGRQPFKGHDFVYSTAPKHLKILNLGNPSKIKPPENVTSFRVLRPEMARHINRCKVGIVTVSSKIDSCPRVIPEMIACDIPIIVLDGVRFWEDQYIESGFSSRYPFATGEIATKEHFWTAVEFVLERLEFYKPREYYDHILSLKCAADFIRKKIGEVSENRI